PGVEFFSGVLVPLLAADVGLIDFHDAGQLGQLGAASLAQPVQDEPRRLLGDANLLGQLHAADALASRDQHVHGEQPLVERHMGPLEDRAGADREILQARQAAVVAVLAGRYALAGRADRAARTVWPQPRLKVHAGGLLIGEQLKELERAYGNFVVHRFTLEMWANHGPKSSGSQVYKSPILIVIVTVAMGSSFMVSALGHSVEPHHCEQQLDLPYRRP